MFQLKITRDKFEDLVKKMSLPTTVKDEFIFPIIAPKFFPNSDMDGFLNSYMEWIGMNKQITAWIRAEGLNVSGITEPTRIALSATSVATI